MKLKPILSSNIFSLFVEWDSYSSGWYWGRWLTRVSPHRSPPWSWWSATCVYECWARRRVCWENHPRDSCFHPWILNVNGNKSYVDVVAVVVFCWWCNERRIFNISCLRTTKQYTVCTIHYFLNMCMGSLHSLTRCCLRWRRRKFVVKALYWIIFYEKCFNAARRSFASKKGESRSDPSLPLLAFWWIFMTIHHVFAVG